MQLLHFLWTLPILLDGASASPLGNVEKRNAPSCCVSGYGHGQYVVNKRECSVSKCAASCKKSSNCQSYGYGNKVCRLYSVPVKNNVRPMSDSPYKFYDKACSSPATKPTTTTKKVTPKPTTSCTTTTTKKAVTTTPPRSGTSSSTTLRPSITYSSTTSRSSTSTTTSSTVASTSSMTTSRSSTSTTTTSTVSSTSSALSSTSTTTIPVTTTTSSTTTAAATTTSTTTTPLACPSNLPFTLESVRNDDTFNAYTGYIPQESMDPRTDSANLVFEPGVVSAIFTLDSSCHLVSSVSGNPAVVGLSQAVVTVIFDAIPGFFPGVCTVLASGSLSCNFGSRTGTANQFALDDMGNLYVGENPSAGVTRVDVVVQFQPPTSTTTTSSSSTTTSASTTTTTSSSTTTSASTTTTAPAVACQSNLPFTLSSLSNDDSGITTGYLPQEMINGPRTDPDYLFFTSGNTAAVFTLDSSCHLVSSRSGHPATLVSGESTTVNFDPNADVVLGVCSIQSAGGVNGLFCTFGSRTGDESQFAKDDAGRLHVGADYDNGIFQTTVLVNFQ